jgi:hypothetical protein
VFGDSLGVKVEKIRDNPVVFKEILILVLQSHKHRFEIKITAQKRALPVLPKRIFDKIFFLCYQ